MLQIIELLKPRMAKFDGMKLRERAGLAAAIAAVLYFIFSIALVAPLEARDRAHKKRLETQKIEFEAVAKTVSELSAALERDPNAPRLAQLDSVKRTIAEADLMAAQLDAAGPRTAAEALRELLSATPGVELVSIRTLPAVLLFQSKAAPASPGKPAPDAKDAAPKPPRLIYRYGTEIRLQGNYLALLPYLEKLEKLPGRSLYWTDISLNVGIYPLAAVTLTVYTLSGQAISRLG